MKNLFLSAAALVAFATATTTVTANTINPGSVYSIQDTAKTDSVSKTPVKVEELPDSVKATLNSEQVKVWTPTAAFLVKGNDGSEYYQVDLSKGEEKAFLRIDKDGKIVQ